MLWFVCHWWLKESNKHVSYMYICAWEYEPAKNKTRKQCSFEVGAWKGIFISSDIFLIRVYRKFLGIHWGESLQKAPSVNFIQTQMFGFQMLNRHVTVFMSACSIIWIWKWSSRSWKKKSAHQQKEIYFSDAVLSSWQWNKFSSHK